MDINRALSSFKDDEEWIKKFLIGSVLMLTLIGTIPVLGWLVAFIHDKLEDKNAKLPDWNDFGTYLVDGLKITALGIIWSLPILAIMCLQYTIIFGAIGGAAVLEPQLGEEAIFSMIMGANLISYCFYPIIFLYSVVLNILFFPAYGIFAESKSLSKTMDPRNAYKTFRGNIGEFIVILAVIMGLGFFLAPLGFFLCTIGIFPVYMYIYTVLGDLVAQAYKKSKSNMELAEQTAA